MNIKNMNQTNTFSLDTIKIITTTEIKKHISEIIDKVKYKNRIFGIGKKNKIEALVIKFPENFNNKLSKITNVNSNSSSFNFLEKEPDLYNINNLRKT